MDKNFLWGGATASYQCEGACDVDGKVESMWDRYGITGVMTSFIIKLAISC